MLPPQLRPGATASTRRIGSSRVLQTPSNAHSRSYFKGHGDRWAWSSRLDPVYARYARVRTLKTRAQLLKTLRRRRSFEWDASVKPLLTPSNLRFASHWRGRQWYTNEDPKQRLKEEADAQAEEKRKAEEEGYELSQREKAWKEQMEAMRKRIAQDPYEAVFGKRFEPFWSPLVPSWMHGNMESSTSSKNEHAAGKSSDDPTDRVNGFLRRSLDSVKQELRDVRDGREKLSATEREERIAELRTCLQDASTLKSSVKDLRKEYASLKDEKQAMPSARYTERLRDIDRRLEDVSTSAEAASVLSAAAKPFSRMTKRERQEHVSSIVDSQGSARKTEPQAAAKPTSYAYASSTSWDSLSNKTKRVEWDSVSEQTKTFEYDPISNRMVEIKVSSKTPKAAIDSDSSATRQPPSASHHATPKAAMSSNKVADVPSQQSDGMRKSIPIPPPSSNASQNSASNSIGTALAQPKSTAVSTPSVKPAALARLPAQDLDLLTADRVRASMGKQKERSSARTSSSLEEKAQQILDFDKNARSRDAEVEAILQERSLGTHDINATSAWDRAEMEDILRREADSLSKRKEKLMNDEKGLFHIERQKRELLKLDDRLKALVPRIDAISTAMPGAPTTSVDAQASQPLRESLQPDPSRTVPSMLQSSVDRMQSKDLPKVAELDLDDAAAHESTEPLAPQAAVPKEWTEAADILQADRVKRTADKSTIEKRSFPKTRWLDDMNARKVAYEHRKAEAQAAEDAKNAESNARREKSRQMLEAEVAETKLKMQAFEGRYADKVKSLRGELDTALKQSSIHSEKHLERIRELEAEVSGLRAKERKYAEKVKSLRDELERAYKQSAVHAEKHLERIRYLEGEVESSATRSQASKEKTAEIIPAEGDICVNAPSFGNNGKWYKRPATPFESDKAKIEQAEHGMHDDALAQELQGIYESRYGPIVESHEQPPTRKRKVTKAKARQVVEIESDVDLGEELAKYEKEVPAERKPNASPTATESAEKIKGVVAGSLAQATSNAEKGVVANGIQWAEPPLYKVLAYDSGNDKMTSATMATSILPDTGMERPLGIQKALSGLYQPARFVPYFAELQNDRFQAIHATQDVVVFRQVKAVELWGEKELEQTIEASTRDDPHRYMIEEADQKGRWIQEQIQVAEKQGAGKAAKKGVKKETRVNPVDGTGRRHMEPTTGNFASPTGFVNHDPVFPAESQDEQAAAETHSDTYSTIAKEPLTKTSRQIWEALPGSSETPVKRQEPVFSGMSRKERQSYSKRMQQEAHERGRLRNLARKEERAERARLMARGATRPREQQGRRGQASTQGMSGESDVFGQQGEFREQAGSGEERSFAKKGGSNVWKYMAGAGVGAAGVTYAIATLAEKQRGEDGVDMARRRLEQRAKRLEDEAARLTREWERR